MKKTTREILKKATEKKECHGGETTRETTREVMKEATWEITGGHEEDYGGDPEGGYREEKNTTGEAMEETTRTGDGEDHGGGERRPRER